MAGVQPGSGVPTITLPMPPPMHHPVNQGGPPVVSMMNTGMPTDGRPLPPPPPQQSQQVPPAAAAAAAAVRELMLQHQVPQQQAQPLAQKRKLDTAGVLGSGQVAGGPPGRPGGGHGGSP